MTPRLATRFLQVALGASFLSAVAGRAGLWGAHAGHPAEAFAAFLGYLALLNPWAPPALLPALGALATALEGSLGLLLWAGVRPRLVGRAAAALLGTFALAMSAFEGPKAALDYSVWSAAGGALLLSTLAPAPAR